MEGVFQRNRKLITDPFDPGVLMCAGLARRTAPFARETPGALRKAQGEAKAAHGAGPGLSAVQPDWGRLREAGTVHAAAVPGLIGP